MQRQFLRKWADRIRERWKKLGRPPVFPDHGCWENLAEALGPWGIPAEDIPSPFNIFQTMEIDGKTGQHDPQGHPSEAGHLSGDAGGDGLPGGRQRLPRGGLGKEVTRSGVSSRELKLTSIASSSGATPDCAQQSWTGGDAGSRQHSRRPDGRIRGPGRHQDERKELNQDERVISLEPESFLVLTMAGVWWPARPAAAHPDADGGPHQAPRPTQPHNRRPRPLSPQQRRRPQPTKAPVSN